jgi:hypothetical protein
MSQTQILRWCIALIVLELNHLKWIWWTYWECAKCGRKHKDCDCGSKWVSSQLCPTIRPAHLRPLRDHARRLALDP